MTDEYEIGKVQGYQVTGKDFYSKVFDKFDDAVALKKKMEETSGKEKIVPMTVSKEKIKNAKK